MTTKKQEDWVVKKDGSIMFCRGLQRYFFKSQFDIFQIQSFLNQEMKANSLTLFEPNLILSQTAGSSEIKTIRDRSLYFKLISAKTMKGITDR